MKDHTWQRPNLSSSDKPQFKMTWTSNCRENSLGSPTQPTKNWGILRTSPMNCLLLPASVARCLVAHSLLEIDQSLPKIHRMRLRKKSPSRRNCARRNRCLRTSSPKCKWSWTISRNSIFSSRTSPMINFEGISNSEWTLPGSRNQDQDPRSAMAPKSWIRKIRVF